MSAFRRIGWGLAALVLAASAAAQPASRVELSAQDREFLRKAMEGGRTEVILGKLAQEKSANAEIRRFGQQMVQAHSKAGERLEALAQKHRYQPPQGPEANKKEDIITALSDLGGDEFDLAYAKSMVKAHEQSVALFAKQAKEGDAPALREFAGKTLPVLRRHLEMARALQ